MRIYKYHLEIADEQELWLPMRAKILTVEMQHEKLCLWAMINHEHAPIQKHLIRIFGTGFDIKNDESLHYIGTVHTLNGNLVWHVFHELV